VRGIHPSSHPTPSLQMSKPSCVLCGSVVKCQGPVTKNMSSLFPFPSFASSDSFPLSQSPPLIPYPTLSSSCSIMFLSHTNVISLFIPPPPPVYIQQQQRPPICRRHDHRRRPSQPVVAQDPVPRVSKGYAVLVR
jgi:hypothetical protein